MMLQARHRLSFKRYCDYRLRGVRLRDRYTQTLSPEALRQVAERGREARQDWQAAEES